MLRELHITTFALIDELALTFAPGLNVLTGETGAGKSMITRAIGLLCGDRAATDLIRSDADEAEIAGIFDLADTDAAILSDCGLTPTEDLLVRRTISRSGKGRVFINGSLATAAVLAQLGSRLIHVYGQHEHALLLKPESHLDFLDQFGKLDAARGEMAATYHAFREAADRLAALTAGGEAARQRAELLRFQVNELREAEIARGEEQQLAQERDVQRNAERLTRACQQSEDALYSGEQAITTGLSRVVAQLHDAARIDPAFREPADLLHQATAQVEDVALSLRRTAERLRPDPERLEQIEDRLALYARFKRKYGCDADALVDRLGEFETELARLEDSTVDVAVARQTLTARAAQAWTVARELSHTRQDAAVNLEKRMAEELRALGMRGAAFRAVFTVAASAGPQAGYADPEGAGAGRMTALGADAVQFYLSANPGEDPKPLARIASGGELSRIMLALKALTAGAGDVQTLIFDEVDAGIGGAVAEAVGKRLHALGRSRQVLCITHLPQIAVLADNHFAVEKRVMKGRTVASARALRADERVREITRMLGGTATAESQRYARRLLESADKPESA